MKTNNVAIYVFYDKKGIVDDYVIFMLQELLKVVSRLVVICNGELTPEGRQKLVDLTPDVYTRDNIGWDAWAYKSGIEYVGWDNLHEYDSMVILNDSIYGPFYPFQGIFEEMEQKNLDFWGMTKHGESPDYTGLTKKGIYPEHIQSYFYVVNKRMLSSPEFRIYWEKLPKFNSWNAAIAFHEVVFTKHFEALGYSWDVYVNTDDELDMYSDIAQIHQMIFELVRDYKCPVIKRKNFTIEYGHFFALTLGDGTRKAFEYIRDHTDYDTNLIWDNVLRTSNIRFIKDNLHLNYLLPDDHVKGLKVLKGAKTRDVGSLRVALMMHLTDENQIGRFVDHAGSMPENADIYIATAEHIKDAVSEAFEAVNLIRSKMNLIKSDKEICEVSALWVALKPQMKNYDYVCYIHDKKQTNMQPGTIDIGFTHRCLENLLASKDYVVNVLNTFESNPRLGIAFSPPANHAGLEKYTPNQIWGADHDNCLALATRLGIDVPMDEDSLVYPDGGMFWFRPDALSLVEEHEWDYSDFTGSVLEKLYCYAAQSEGYFPAWIMTNSFSSSEITAMMHLLSQIHPARQTKLWSKIRFFGMNTLRKNQQLYFFVRRIYRFAKRMKWKLRGGM